MVNISAWYFHFSHKTNMRQAGKMAHLIKVLGTKPEELTPV